MTGKLDLKHKFCAAEAPVVMDGDAGLQGYASYFGLQDKGGDIVAPGAYAKSLERLTAKGGRVKMLWQHDPAQPIGVWDEVRETEKGLYVKGRLLTSIEKGREAAALVEAGGIDGLSIGYRAIKAQKDRQGRRLLTEIELWEVSLVTFPMLAEARIGSKADDCAADLLQDLAALFHQAGRDLAP